MSLYRVRQGGIGSVVNGGLSSTSSIESISPDLAEPRTSSSSSCCQQIHDDSDDPDRPPVTTTTAADAAWFWDNKRFCVSYLGSAASGRCRFCFQETTGMRPTLMSGSFDVLFCDDQCRQQEQKWAALTRGHHRDDVVQLAPSCQHRESCNQCIRAKDKHSPERPCKTAITELAIRNATKPKQYLTALVELLELFLTYLYKHENDPLKNSAQSLSVLFDNPADRPPGAIVHLFVTIIHYLDPMAEVPITHWTISEKLLAFYNLMTLYHRQFNMFARFGTQHFLWWDVYIANWASFCEWLLGMVFFVKLTEDCSCSLRHLVDIPLVMPTLQLPRRRETRNGGIIKGGKKRSFSLTFEAGADASNKSDWTRKHCAVCMEDLLPFDLQQSPQPQQRHPHWIDEFLRSDKETLSFPCERIWPRRFTKWDLLLNIFTLGSMPVGLLCSDSCLRSLNEGTFPHRMRRLLKCSSKCSNIVIRPSNLFGIQTCRRSDCNLKMVLQPSPSDYQSFTREVSNWKSKRRKSITVVGSFRKCHRCREQTVMLESCETCMSRFYCSASCRTKDHDHGCEILQRSLMRESLVLLDTWSTGWTMLGRGDAFTSNLDLNMCFQCHSCRPIAIQYVLDRCYYDGSLFNVLHLALERVFPMDLNAVQPPPEFSEVHLTKAVLVMEQLFRLFPHWQEHQRLTSQQLSSLKRTFDFWLHQHKFKQRYEPAECPFYDYTSLRSEQEAVLKFAHLYCAVLAVKSAFHQVQDMSEAAQKDRAIQLVSFQLIFVEALSITRSSALLPLLRVEPEGRWVNLRSEVLQTFGWLFSFSSKEDPSPKYLQFEMFCSVLQGHEPTVQLKPLESRLIITVTLIGWFVSKNVGDFACLVQEIQVVARAYISRPRCLYYQPLQMGPTRLYDEEPTTLLQNYIIMVKILTLEGECVNFVLELNMLEPISLLLNGEGDDYSDQRRQLLLDMSNGELFKVVLLDMLDSLVINASHLVKKNLEKLLDPKLSFMKIVGICRKCFIATDPILPGDAAYEVQRLLFFAFERRLTRLQKDTIR